MTTEPLTITPAELNAKAARGEPVELIDVRTPIEFREVHATPARNLPLDTLDARALLEGRDKDKPLYFICKGGDRGRMACRKLLDAGAQKIVNAEGGTQAWTAAGLPVVQGKNAVSLERQVRIAAGTLVLIGIGLGVLVNPYWLGLSAFVGAGLVFAGITDTCGMGMLMAKMPWNRVNPDGKACKLPARG
ncbi:MAG: rhodanese-like domain-containing protein [Planctomycetes bacterium]|nr:rhodanese-like domain-containing protein [Planctomycetota bacterium]